MCRKLNSSATKRFGSLWNHRRMTTHSGTYTVTWMITTTCAHCGQKCQKLSQFWYARKHVVSIRDTHTKRSLAWRYMFWSSSLLIASRVLVSFQTQNKRNFIFIPAFVFCFDFSGKFFFFTFLSRFKNYFWTFFFFVFLFSQNVEVASWK